MKNLSYEERLKELGLPSLSFRRFREDLITCFKLTKMPHLFENIFIIKNRETRNFHPFSILKKHSKTKFSKYCLENRIITSWNHLPKDCFQMSLDGFKNYIAKSLDFFMYHTDYPRVSRLVVDRMAHSPLFLVQLRQIMGAHAPLVAV